MIAQDHRKLRLLLTDCASGFYQQMYFLGKDVMHSKGNQLVEYGFKKSASRGLKGTSCYTLNTDVGVLELYGSCAGFYTDKGNIVFVRKRGRFYQWLPEHRLVAGCWRQEDLKILPPDEMLALMEPLLTWWVNYEKWIIQRLGQPYRELCHKECKKVNKSMSWLVPTTAAAWVEKLMAKGDEHVRPKHFLVN